MEKIAVLLIPVLLGFFLLKLLMKPLQLGLKLALHSAAGVTCLTLLNGLSPLFGISIPINAVTTLVATLAGLPGITLLAAMELLPI